MTAATSYGWWVVRADNEDADDATVVAGPWPWEDHSLAESHMYRMAKDDGEYRVEYEDSAIGETVEFNRWGEDEW